MISIMKNKLLVGTGILFILSILTGSPLILTICLTLFVIAVVINCYDMWKGQNIIGYMFDKVESNAIVGFKNKQYRKAIINIIATPMVMIGIVMVILSVIIMWISVID